MRRAVCVLLLLPLLGACRHDRKSETRPRTETGTVLPREERRDTDARVAVTAVGETFLLYRWSFDMAHTSFAIVDLGMRGSLVEALGPLGRVAINAGFFDPDGRPIGLAVSEGSGLSKFSRTMSGGVFFAVDGVAQVQATEDFDPGTRVDVAVQCRPRLVVGGRPNVRSDDGQRAARTALCVRDGGKTVDVLVAEPSPGTRGPSLFALSQYLSAEHRCEDALNLDGGPSTGAAFREGDAASPKVLPPHGPLRYALVVR
jgi:hypothetical protein